jgi:predicted esterase
MQRLVKGRDIYLIPSIHTYTIVWLHGLGDSAEGFVDLFSESPLLPNCKVVLPTAPTQPVTINGGMSCNSWYDFKNLTDEYDVSAESSVAIIKRYLEEEAKTTNKLILGGFSQGAVMSLYTALSKYSGKIDAVIALSGYSFPMQIPEDRKSIPVFLFNGGSDPVLPLNRCQQTFTRNLQGINTTYRTEPHLQHTVTMQEWNEVKVWLRAQLN